MRYRTTGLPSAISSALGSRSAQNTHLARESPERRSYPSFSTRAGSRRSNLPADRRPAAEEADGGQDHGHQAEGDDQERPVALIRGRLGVFTLA